jgi:Bardet-Biedl syndrome 5 protein
MLNSVVAVHKAYDSSRLYREIRLRSSLLNKGQLRILPKERLHNRYNGVWNLSSDQVYCFLFLLRRIWLFFFFFNLRVILGFFI